MLENMTSVKNINADFHRGLRKLGFADGDIFLDDALFLVNTQPNNLPDIAALFHIYSAKEFGATAVYLRKQMNGSYKPQVYLYDKTQTRFANRSEGELADIQKKLWTSGEVPLACIFYDTHVSILDCTRHVSVDNDELKPDYLIQALNFAGKAHKLYNEQFAVKIKSGIFWEEKENRSRFKFQNSAYDVLINNIRHVEKELAKELKNVSKEIIAKIIVQSILIKYLEERIDSKGNRLLSDKYFKKYDSAQTFGDVLRKRKLVELLEDLNDKNRGFNGNVFEWKDNEKEELKKLDLSIVADLLASDRRSLSSSQREIQLPDWRYFEFRYIPVELISRLYEEFLGANKKKEGLYYTPAHLAKLLVDECLPLKSYNEVNLSDYKILDPACGSGIFLVLIFKRLVQIWKLQNNLEAPSIGILKSLLQNIYGVDKEGQAIRLASFSLCLALCDELKPMQIINELKFDDLRKDNLIEHDFFTCEKIKDKKFDLVIGNPPFVRGSVSSSWIANSKKIKTPQGQIALKFLAESFPALKDKGLACLIIKASGLLYNSTSKDYKKALFENYDVVQILDFTALQDSYSLWDKSKTYKDEKKRDKGARVAAASIFIRNEKPDFTKNILHVTFRRTKAVKERITFEIDAYDLHYVNRRMAIENEFVWKNNLLGGGRIKTLVEKIRNLPTLQEILKENSCIAGEGYIVGKKGKLSPDFIYNIQTLPTKAISENGIDYSALMDMDRNVKFVKVGSEKLFTAPNVILWENIGANKLPIFYNEKSFSFKAKLIGIASANNNCALLKKIAKSFDLFYSFYKFYMYVCSSQLLLNRNTAVLKQDFMQLPFVLKDGDKDLFSAYDEKIISDVNIFMQDFVRIGENSKAVKPIKQENFQNILTNYGIEFSKVLNLMYETSERKFRLSHVLTLKNSLIAAVFKYGGENSEAVFSNNLSELNMEALTENKISSALSVNRIVKLYPQKDTVVFVKPNQHRYWLSLTAYRDADSCFADFADSGF
ncbi:MAG: SAM-dependent methyltransferase [Prevotellaceae bacterium]|jgi:methylase of polypeptide subunit release factors|nr:SAM-dependent methyltransferase [Prevotellaceae bacterium]